jgi:hypothetical protein
MKAYQGIITKEEFVHELKAHQKADDFIRGAYWKEGKGCAVGCSIESVSRLKNLELKNFSDYEKYPELLGIPEWLAQLEDALFENMALKKSKSWPVDFAEAIHTGADLEKIRVPFLVVLLRHSLVSLSKVQFDASRYPGVNQVIMGSHHAVQQMIEAQESGDQEKILAAHSAADSAARSAHSAASSVMYLAARSAAYSAVDSAACSAADSAACSAHSADSAAYAANSAVDSAADSAAYAAAYSAHSAVDSADSAAYLAAHLAAHLAKCLAVYDYFADELLKLLRECK